MSSFFRELIRKAPPLAAVVAIVLIIALVPAIVAAVNAGRGVSFSIFGYGLKIDEYHSPEVQKCELLASAFPAASSMNSDVVSGMENQIINLRQYMFERNSPQVTKTNYAAHEWHSFDPFSHPETANDEIRELSGTVQAISNQKIVCT